MAHCTALLLTTAAYASAIKSSLPELGYLTMLDKYMLSNLLHLALSVTEGPLALLISGSWTVDDSELTRPVHLAVGCTHMGLWLLIQVWFGCKASGAFEWSREALGYTQSSGSLQKIGDAEAAKHETASAEAHAHAHQHHQHHHLRTSWSTRGNANGSSRLSKASSSRASAEASASKATCLATV